MGNQQPDRNEREDDIIEDRPALKLERLRAQIELNEKTHTGPGDRRDAGENAQHFGEGERHQRKVGAAQSRAEGKPADDTADRSAGCNAGEKSDPGIDAVVHLQDGGDVGAGAEKGRVPKRILSAVTADDVPALAGERDH